MFSLIMLTPAFRKAITADMRGEGQATEINIRPGNMALHLYIKKLLPFPGDAALKSAIDLFKLIYLHISKNSTGCQKS